MFMVIVDSLINRWHYYCLLNLKINSSKIFSSKESYIKYVNISKMNLFISEAD